jgi:hypothetical protein
MAEDRVMEERDRDELDSDATDEEIRGLGDEEFEEAEGEEEDLEDEDDLADTERITGEVGDEGGSPGETEKVKKQE